MVRLVELAADAAGERMEERRGRFLRLGWPVKRLSLTYDSGTEDRGAALLPALRGCLLNPLNDGADPLADLLRRQAHPTGQRRESHGLCRRELARTDRLAAVPCRVFLSLVRSNQGPSSGSPSRRDRRKLRRRSEKDGSIRLYGGRPNASRCRWERRLEAGAPSGPFIDLRVQRSCMKNSHSFATPRRKTGRAALVLGGALKNWSEASKIWTGRRKTIQAAVNFGASHSSATPRRKTGRAVLILGGALKNLARHRRFEQDAAKRFRPP